MDGQFLVRQIYDDEITYNLVSSAAQILSKYYKNYLIKYCAYYYDVHVLIK